MEILALGISREQITEYGDYHCRGDFTLGIPGTKVGSREASTEIDGLRRISP